MPFNNFNIGTDVTLQVVTQQGVLLSSLLTNFKSKQRTTDKTIKGLDGIMRPLLLPDGWEGNFEYERGSSALDDFIAELEASYYSGSAITGATILETITETNGLTSQYRYEGVVFKLTDAGEWKGDSSVKMTLEFLASTRTKVV